MDDLGSFCCQNSNCLDVGKRGHGNRSVTSRYGPNKARRMLRCSTCKARFSERKGTPLVKARLTPTTAVAVLAHVAEGVGTRKTARLTGVHHTDEYPVYEEAIRGASGQVVVPPRTGRPGRSRKPHTVVPPALTYATVHKEKENNRVVRVNTRVVFGTAAAVALAVAASAVGRVVNTSFVERHNGTDRDRCSRKVRKSYGFSKDWEVHRGATVFSYFSYNFCWPVRTRRVKGEDGRWQKRTPAMVAGLTDHVWSLAGWLNYPARHVQRK